MAAAAGRRRVTQHLIKIFVVTHIDSPAAITVPVSLAASDLLV